LTTPPNNDNLDLNTKTGDLEMSKLDKLSSLIPLEEIEYEAQSQIFSCLGLPFCKKMAIMPDVHTGYSLPIGGVALLDGVISPAYVGYDIGCGMIYYDTGIPVRDILPTKKVKEKAYKGILDTVPVGFNLNETGDFPFPEFHSASGNKELNKYVNLKLLKSLNSLGGGNHFLELGENGRGTLGITVHCGSRNPGHQVASYYMNLSKTVDTDLFKDFLYLDGEYGQMYLKDLNYMLEYALENRSLILKSILKVLGLKMNRDFINENHNHAEVLDSGVLHRKGATPAEKGQFGVIPGNMRDGVYITKGLGNEEYLCSASHGAGRKGSRKWAKNTFKLEAFQNTMKGIVCKAEKGTLDESPFAYKDINTVIEYQKGIVVDIIDHVKPLINIKG
jgi:tRNA-splicing ligase RtcB (3'-phosphate/5'-hydroxy nucleic acid ligase)